ncbi:alpha-amylase family glycosyl hydrolase [Rudaea sp.]|uniref:alpha-amylase family glycosyl hydrolase n=1 Tax=Rudaea sp. TaxID=2136325 RepID=UPI0032202DDB
MRKTIFLAAGATAALGIAAVLAGCATSPGPTAAASPAATNCPPPPYKETLFLRGKMNDGTPREDYAFQWRCNAYFLNVDLSGEQKFRINDASLGGGIGFGGPPDATTALRAGAAFALTGGRRVGTGELKYAFTGPATIKLDFAGAGGKPTLAIGTKSFVDIDEKPIDDAVALSLRFDSRSRDPGYKQPFGAITAGNDIEVWLSALPGVGKATLVIDKRRLEGWQEVLEYAEVARVPLEVRKFTDAGGKPNEVWTGRYKFDAIGIYGYYFEVEIGGRKYLYTNNADPVPFTREVGSQGLGTVVNPPSEPSRIRRYRQTVYRADYKVPDWARDAVYYYIFPDRFRNGDPSNDPKPGIDKFHGGTVEFHKNWLDKPWLPHSGDGSDDLYSNDFFGGDLKGITDKLDYIKALGANALYINPIFRAASNHKYDTADYLQIDPHFGTSEEFEKLNREAAKRGIRVVLDTSLNHVGRDSLYFNRYGNFPEVGAFDRDRIQPQSKYYPWFTFYPDEKNPDLEYKGWAGIPDLPELDKSQRSLRDYFYGGKDGVMQHWLDRGLSGWRMDVAPWVPDDFWREWRTAVKTAKPDAVTVAETFFDASKFFLGDEFDSTMNYIFRSSVVAYANGAKASDVWRNIELMRENYPPQAFSALMNLIDSHDSPRALHDFGWTDVHADAATIALAKQRLRLAAFLQMTMPGAPAIYYGDEVGVTGGDDPFDRGTYPWTDLGGKPDEALLADYQRLTKLRHDHPVLRHGSLDAPAYVDDHVVVLVRRDGDDWAITATNNDAAPRTVRVNLPATLHGAGFVDALDGAQLAEANGVLELEVPARFGRVLTLAHGTAQANVHVLAQKLKMPGLDRERTLRIYLPPGYEKSSKRYPVLYMHDGQNLFDATTSYSGEWGVDETLNELAKTKGLELIVVGIDHGGEHRIQELDAWDNAKFGKGEGRQYMDFVVGTVKPYIDQHYRTKPGRADTAIMGSSMGGLISQYAIEQYPQVFSRAGMFSPAYWPAKPAVFDFARTQPPRKDAKLYFYAGGKEGEEMVGDMQRMVAQLRAQGHPPARIATTVAADAQHNEAAWRAQFARAVLWLFDRNG